MFTAQLIISEVFHYAISGWAMWICAYRQERDTERPTARLICGKCDLHPENPYLHLRFAS